MIIVTGGAGFIGSNLVKGLNKQGNKNILVVDDLFDGKKFKNLVNCEIVDYLDKDNFISKIKNDENFGDKITAIFHNGACSVTTEWNGKYMMENNYEYSKTLLHYCLQEKISFIYASSAAVYGGGNVFREDHAFEAPLNIYGYSKYLFDQYVRKFLPYAKSQIVGLRYFNVYGPNEAHKDNMASVIYHFNQQILREGKIKIFQAADGYGDGEHLRDFVFVDDVVKVNLWFLQQENSSGIYNVGTGHAESFNAVAQAVINWHKRGVIEYIPFPDNLLGVYQSFTEADLSKLRSLGYKEKFTNIKDGVKKYLDAK